MVTSPWAHAYEVLYLPINLCDIYYSRETLHHRCVKTWMVKIWQIFGWLSISRNFIGAKVSLHVVISNILVLKIISKAREELMNKDVLSFNN